MRRAIGGLAASLALAGCIPQVAQDYRAAHPEPGREPPRHGPDRRVNDDAPPPDRVEPDPASPDRYPRRPSDDAPPPEDDVGIAPDRPVGRADLPPGRSPGRGFPATSSPRPVWETRPATPDAQIVAAGSYTVRPGDTLGRIAQVTGAGTGAIARENGLAPPFTVREGQRLAIPGGRYHVVRPGQAGIAIARAYGVEWSRIVAANGLAEPFVLGVGERILIPGPAPGNSHAAERAAAFRLDVDDILTGGEPAPAIGQAPVRPVARPGRTLPATAVVVAPARLTGGFAWPVDGSVTKRFGPGASGVRNDGIKIAVARGTPIRATANGVVAYVGDGIAALGGLVIVKHGDGWTSIYGHASRLLVQRGQAVKQGQTIALSGDTGFADRPQVHFELRKGRVPVDPLSQLPRR
jgi:murein DD-endopeptidase MepM/ murein hydrolase activator NlpD